MKNTFFALALLLVFGSAAMAQRQARTEVYKPHYVVVDADDDKTRQYYEYDEDYLLSSLEYQQMVEGAWETYLESFFEYDFNGNVLEILTKDATIDENISLETTTYTSGRPTETIYQEWDGSDWLNVRRLAYDYIDDMSTIVLSEWSGTNWTVSYLYTFTQSGNVAEKLVQYMQGGAWQNEQKITTTYNDNDTKSEVVIEMWESGAWMNSSKYSYHYTNGLFDVVTSYLWNSGSWVENAKCEYEYDNHGNAIAGEHFCKEGSNWNNCFGTLEMAYGHNAGMEEFDGLRFDAVYVELTEVEENAEETGFALYPNPASDVLNIRGIDVQKAEIYSLTGAKLLETTSNSVDVKGLESGMYLLKVYDTKVGCKARVFVVK